MCASRSVFSKMGAILCSFEASPDTSRRGSVSFTALLSEANLALYTPSRRNFSPRVCWWIYALQNYAPSVCKAVLRVIATTELELWMMAC